MKSNKNEVKPTVMIAFVSDNSLAFLKVLKVTESGFRLPIRLVRLDTMGSYSYGQWGINLIFRSENTQDTSRRLLSWNFVNENTSLHCTGS